LDVRRLNQLRPGSDTDSRNGTYSQLHPDEQTEPRDAKGTHQAMMNVMRARADSNYRSRKVFPGWYIVYRDSVSTGGCSGMGIAISLTGRK
jgi:hypothetical protein